MKHIKLASAAAIALGLAIAGSASAQTQLAGSIQFAGSVTDTTCIVQGGDGTNKASTNFKVTLDPTTVDELAAAGDTANATGFSVVLGGPGSGTCSVGTVASFAFDPNSQLLDKTTGRLNNGPANGAKNVQVQLLDGGPTGTPIDLNNYSVNFPALVNNQAEIKFGAEYYATAQTEAGQVLTDVLYVVNYN